jgi:hypothetical protein
MAIQKRLSSRMTSMRWFYAFLLLLVAWSGLARTVLRDEAPQWKTWEQPR